MFIVIVCVFLTVNSLFCSFLDRLSEIKKDSYIPNEQVSHSNF